MKEKLNALWAAAKMLFAEMKNINTEQGVLYYEEDELKVGIPMYVEEGPAPDGEYVSDSRIYVIKDGVLAEIKEKEEPKEEPAEPVEENMACGDKKEDLGCGGKKELADEPKEEPAEPAEPKEEPKENEEDKIAPIFEALKAMEDRIVALEAALKDIAKAPEGTTPADGFSKVSPLSEYGSGIEAIKAMKASMRVK